MQIDTSGWSGDGDFTTHLVEALRETGGIEWVRVQDAPASRSGVGFSFLANEVFVRFRDDRPRLWTRLLGLSAPGGRRARSRLTLSALEEDLAARDDIGPADYQDEGMLQYLRTERMVQPHQTRGHKLVELVRVYAVRSLPG